ncbi:hypothetical protein ACIF83_41345 [Streptomyces sp. NPDC085866]|uniref:hypothetical protein n=1 Tax=Streptomyces sp. NPDC085866 TaxID=3365736 RepID=UPI0037D1E94E
MDNTSGVDIVASCRDSDEETNDAVDAARRAKCRHYATYMIKAVTCPQDVLHHDHDAAPRAAIPQG